jgi:hypothetical protein
MEAFTHLKYSIKNNNKRREKRICPLALSLKHAKDLIAINNCSQELNSKRERDKILRLC